MSLNYLLQYFNWKYNNADKIKSIDCIKQSWEGLIRVLNFNTLYWLHKWNNPIQSFNIFRSVLKKIHIKWDLAWINNHSNQAQKIVDICKKIDADIVILNEVLYDIPVKGFIENWLKSLWYNSVFRWKALHSNATINKPEISSWIILAYKWIARLLEDNLWYSDHWWWASGGYCIEINDFNLVVIWLHLGLWDPNRQKFQRSNLKKIIKNKLDEWKNILVAWDFNQDPWNIENDLWKFNLNLFTAPSFPAFCWIPPVRALDQIWTNKEFWILINHFMFSTFSDHFAQVIDLKPTLKN